MAIQVNRPKMMQRSDDVTLAERQKIINDENLVLSTLHLAPTACEDCVHLAVEQFIHGNGAGAAEKQKMIDARIAYSVLKRKDTMNESDAIKAVGKCVENDAMTECEDWRNLQRNSMFAMPNCPCQ